MRNGLWDAGVFVPWRAPVPIISVGGLSTGGSGKTPLAAALARHLADHGCSVAVVTPGQSDEIELHRQLNPDIPVSGGRWRAPVVERAVLDGCSAVVLDSGFQHRRLHRDLDLVAISVEHSIDRERLPAGPYRERFAALDRADGAIVIRRFASARRSEILETELESANRRLFVARARLQAVGLRPANQAAEGVAVPRPAVAVAAIMWPEPFFRTLRSQGLSPRHRIALTDHARYEARTVESIASAAGTEGVVCTRKDAVKLAPSLPEDVPVWWMAEEVVWEEGGDRLLAAVRRTAVSAAAVAPAGSAPGVPA
jgi:tetraacyldisaccharide 4'-kinase